jgi:hypothetical protein
MKGQLLNDKKKKWFSLSVPIKFGVLANFRRQNSHSNGRENIPWCLSSNYNHVDNHKV